MRKMIINFVSAVRAAGVKTQVIFFIKGVGIYGNREGDVSGMK